METISESTNTLQSLSQDLARMVERVSTAVMAINARRNSSSSGVCWGDGVIVSAAHTLRRPEDISVILPSGEAIAATLAGADPSRSRSHGVGSTTKF
jgi:serine protease Do